MLCEATEDQVMKDYADQFNPRKFLDALDKVGENDANSDS